MPRRPLSRQSFRSSSSRRQTFQAAINMIKGCPTKDWHSSSKACQNPVEQSSWWVKIDLNYCSTLLVSPPRRNQAPSKEVYQICIASTALPCKKNCSTSFSSTLQRPTAAMDVLSVNMTKLLWSWRLSSRFLGRRDVQSSNSQVSSMFPKV